MVALMFVSVTRLSVPSSIQVVSEPAGAEVVVDGVAKGVTPLTVKGITRGRHNVELKQEAYQPKVITVDIGAFAQRKYSAKLTPVPPKVAMDSQEAQPQSLTQVFANRAPEKLEAKPEKKVAVAKKAGKKPVRVAQR